MFASCRGLFLGRKKFDIILATSPPLFIGLIAIFLSKLKGIPYIFEIRDLWPESAVDTGVLNNGFLINALKRLEKLLYKHAEIIVVLTPAFKFNLLEKKDVPENKLVYIPNGADLSLSDRLLHDFDANSFRNSLGLTKSFVVIYVGAHGVANHLSQLVDAAELLKATNVFLYLLAMVWKKIS